MKLVEWLAKEVTDDPRALRWFAEPGTDERISAAFQASCSPAIEIDPTTILKTTRMLEDGEKPGSGGGDRHRFLFPLRPPLPARSSAKWTSPTCPGDRILGLGKLPRLVDALARRFQIQEDLVREVAHGDDGIRPRARCACARTRPAPVHVQPRAFEPDVDRRKPSSRLARWTRGLISRDPS